MNEQKKKNAMKKKITFGLVAFAMVASALFRKIISKDDLSAMIQANVDALAEFEFGGQSWNENDTHWVGSNWKPEVVECTGTRGNATYWGQMVKCNTGDGNCYDGTDCI